jgi:putative ABC transport system permease protein
MYSHFFHFPVFKLHLDPAVVLSACGVSAGAAVLGTLTSVWRAVALPPASAMQPEPPASFNPTILERLGFGRFLSEPVKLVLRKLERHPIKAALTCLGIALSVTVLILGSFMLDAVDYAINSQYFVAMREDISVLFVEPSSSDSLHAIQGLPGVRCCEAFRAISTRLRNGPHMRRVTVQGLEPNAELHRLMDIDCREITLPPGGLVLSEKLGDVLGVKVGDTLQVEVLEGERPELELRVVGLIKDFAGTAAYMGRDTLNRAMKEGNVISGAFVSADTAQIDKLYQELKDAPRVASVLITGSTMRSFRNTVGENLLRMRSFVVIFAGVIAVGVVFNSARISLAERSRELATLRVIGFTRTEISDLLFGELALLTAIAVPVGLVMGRVLAWLLIKFSYDTELFRMPLVINRSTYGFAAVVTLVAAAGSALIVRRMLDQLDLIAVLKSRE